MLSPSDEFFTHQAPLPHALVTSSDPGWRERYWLNVAATDGQDVMLVCGLGQYPNTDTQEAFACVAEDGQQHNLRLARSLLPDRDRMQVGPLRIEVGEPLQRLRLVLDDNSSGLAFDLTWQATMPAGLETQHREISRGRLVHDMTRYQQVGRASGRLVTPRGEHEVTSDGWWACRDHSWGIRPLPRVPGAPPASPPDWRFLLFAPLQFKTFAVYLYLYELAPGLPLHLSGTICPAGGDAGEVRIIAVEHQLQWDETQPVPTLAGGRLRLTTQHGDVVDVQVAARPPRGYLRGGGYGGWDGWFQGHWKGDDELVSETWDLADGLIRRYAANSSDHLVAVRCRGERGFGIMEYLVLPGYPAYQGVQQPSRGSGG
jgi:hypothetical protein